MPKPKEILRNARRASQQWVAKRRDSAFATRSDDNRSKSRSSFLDLPPEIRNRIYESLAEATTLIIPPQAPSKAPRPPGLLLACRQTHRELNGIWLSSVQIAAQVCGYDFRALMRILERLSVDQLNELRANPRPPRIDVFLAHVPNKEQWRSLIDWLEYRDTQRRSDTLIFQYEARFTSRIRAPRPAARYVNAHHMQQDLLKAHILRLSRLRVAWRSINASTWEVDRMLPDLEACAGALDEVMRPLAEHWGSMTLEERRAAFQGRS